MNVAQYLTGRHASFQVVPHPETFTAQKMARALHVPGKNVAKTVLLRANGSYRFFIAVVPATKSVDLAKASEALGGSVIHLGTEREVRDFCPDCEVGVLPPFGSQYALQTLLDESLLGNEEVLFEGNTHHEAIRMKLADFIAVEHPRVVSIAR